MCEKNTMQKYVLYGAGKMGTQAYEELGKDAVKFFIDKNKAGGMFDGIKIISLEEYLDMKCNDKILVCVKSFNEVVELLYLNGITNFSLYRKIYMHDDVPMTRSISHLKWIDKLVELADFEGKEVLEIGSRVVTGDIFRDKFKHANYTGFDLYEGPNVDVAGDAHELGKYFIKNLT